MRELLTRSRRWLKVGWFWPLVLLALPNCFLDSTGLGIPPELEPGSNPTSAIMCDIPKFTAAPVCDPDQQFGIPFAHAAVALAEGQTSNFGLDFSQGDAVCSGAPQKIEFFGPFPEGFPVCLNCGTQIPDPHADATAVCIAQCIDLYQNHEGPTPGNITTFCNQNARPSTNFDKSACYDDACENGALKSGFVDPRRTPEPVSWVDLEGTSAPGTELKRTEPTSGTGTDPADFNAGAASAQLIMIGDGWVEFEAAESDKSHVIGLSLSCEGCIDDDPSAADVHFGLNLNFDGRVYVVEGGSLVPGTGEFGSVATYSAGTRFRVAVTDVGDKKATVTYYKVDGPCTPGTPCATIPLYTHDGLADYPLRVDASFSMQNATVTNVTLVRIQ
jgi:hypothetical protein